MVSALGRLSAAATALVLLGTGTLAHADTVKAKPEPQISFTTRDAFTPDANQWGLLGARRSMQWDASKGRWGLKFDMDQPAFRELSQKDVMQAGAYYRVTPSVRVGAAASLGDNKNLATEQAPIQQAPRVRLETTFKF